MYKSWFLYSLIFFLDISILIFSTLYLILSIRYILLDLVTYMLVFFQLNNTSNFLNVLFFYSILFIRSTNHRFFVVYIEIHNVLQYEIHNILIH